MVRSDLNRQVKECFSRCPGHISVKWDNQPSLDKGRTRGNAGKPNAPRMTLTRIPFNDSV